MPLINLIAILIAIGIALYLINNYIPMDVKIKNIINAVVVISVCVWLMRIFGIISSLSYIHAGK